jgi:homoserine kinase type II
MCAFPLDRAALDVLRHYPLIDPSDDVASQGNRGGFSGARIWRVESKAGAFCLKAWPPGGSSPERLRWIHNLMRLARDRDLLFVPAVFTSRQGETWVQHADRVWDLTSWMPGRADFHDHPGPARLEAVCTTLAQLHEVWGPVSPMVGRCPGIQRRLECARDWTAWIQSGWQPRFAEPDIVRPWAERAWSLLRRWNDWIPLALASWAERPLPLQPCLCDVWHDHVLFEGNALSGLIDYGGLKIDHVAVDVARLLGSLIGDNPEQRVVGLRAYTRLRSLSLEEEALLPVLDRTGALVGLANWLKWLSWQPKVFDDHHAAVRRLASLVQRIESW